MGDSKSTPAVLPADNDIQEAPRIIIEPSFSAPDQSFFVFNGAGYDRVSEPWSIEDHVGPAKASVNLGDVASFVAYVLRYHLAERLLLTWNEHGLKAVLDAHQGLDAAGRNQWTAAHPFLASSQWAAWTKFADGRTRWTQQQAVDTLDMLADDIVEPTGSAVIDIIRTLRATVKIQADSEYREDGGALVSFTKDSKLVGKATIPPEIAVQIPVLKGHTLDDGRTPVMYRLPVKVRPSIDDATHQLGFRFLMPTAERVLEAVYADRVQAAKDLLGAELAETLYRATA